MRVPWYPNPLLRLLRVGNSCEQGPILRLKFCLGPSLTWKRVGTATQTRWREIKRCDEINNMNGAADVGH